MIANRPGYSLLADKRDVLPAWLQRAGYRTIHIGKYLNGYTSIDGLEPAPGWDRWLSMVRANYVDPSFSVDGRQIFPGEYLTSWINDKATQMIDRYAPRRKPFYLQLDHFAPHIGSGQEGGRCDGAPSRLPRTSIATRMPSRPRAPRPKRPISPTSLSSSVACRRTPRPSRRAPTSSTAAPRCAPGARPGRGRRLSALRRNHELGSTMIVFWSDNGLSYGEHRIQLAKGLPYEEHVRVPLVIRPPRDFPRRFRAGATVDAPVANIDLAPTILGLSHSDRAGRGSKCRRMDGRSLVPLLKGRKPGWSGSRAIATSFAINAPAYRRSCEWVGFRTPNVKLTEHLQLPVPGGTTCEPSSEYELYDLGSDPFELENLATPSKRQVKRLDRLSRCSGIRHRDPRKRHRPYCE